MLETLQGSITQLLRYQRAPEKATRTFRSWKHNADILPKVQAQLETLLEAYNRFEPVVYDTQGPRDDGSDIVLRYGPKNSDRPLELICFQAKSFDDLTKKRYMQELKAQRDDTFRKVLGIRYYFIFLCTDTTAHKDRVRNIMAEFRSADRTEVIEPVFAYTFLHHPKTRVEALVTRAMEAGDPVFRRALESLNVPSPSARALTVWMAVKSTFTGQRHFSVEQLFADSTLRDIYGELRDRQEALLEDAIQAKLTAPGPVESDNEDEDSDATSWGGEDGDEPAQLEDFEIQIAKDLADLENDVVEHASGPREILLRTDWSRPLNAVVADALARYEYDEEQLISYMFSLMGVRD